LQREKEAEQNADNQDDPNAGNIEDNQEDGQNIEDE
jgi:hypothetical protein